MKEQFTSRPVSWPALPLEEWKDTYATLHMWTQIAGKIRMALSPRVNHWWEVPLYVSAVGLTTSPIPHEGGIFEITFDFLRHRLTVETNNSMCKTMALEPRTVADFYRELMSIIKYLGITVKIWPMPVEVPAPIRFDQDSTHAAYDQEWASTFWQALVASDAVLKEFRARFTGKCSPVHFFWGSFDLAVSRFSGKRAPERPEADAITREAYSHEVISAGFWPGSGNVKDAAYYCYAAPEPAAFSDGPVRPSEAFYDPELKEFLLMYDDVRKSNSPESTLLDFLESSYEAAANRAGWPRGDMERVP